MGIFEDLGKFFGVASQQKKASNPSLESPEDYEDLWLQSDAFSDANIALMAQSRAAAEFFHRLEQETGGSKNRDPNTSNVQKQISFMVNKTLGVNGYARPTRFYFEFAKVGSKFNERLSRNCASISMPGKALATQPLKINGPPAEYPYDVNFTNELTATFRVGADYFERQFFESWVNQAIPNQFHKVNYSNEYKTTLRIYALNQFDSKIYCVELQDCFCKAIGDINFSHDLTDTITTIDVTFSFSEYFVMGWIDVPRTALIISNRAKRVEEQNKTEDFVNNIMNSYNKAAEANTQAEAVKSVAGDNSLKNIFFFNPGN
jgi:hypothetical protein